MTVKELRYLVDNLDEYIHVPGGIERLKKTVLHLAVSGQLVPQDPAEGTGEELFQQIQAEKAKLIAAGKLKKPADRTGGQKPLPAITESEIPFAIPKTWKWVRLGDIGLVGTGATPSRDNPSYYGGNIPWVTSTLTSQEIIYETGEQITEKALAETNCSLYPKGSLVIAMYGQGKTRGQVSQLGIDAATNQACAVFCPIGKLIEVLFIRRNIELDYDKMRLVATGGAQPNLNVQKIKETIVALPPTLEQKRIIEKVNVIFALIDELAEKYRAEQAEREKLVASSLAQLARGNSDLVLTRLSEIIRTKADAAQLRKTILHLAVSGQLVSQDPSEGTGEDLYQQIQVQKAKLIAEGKLKKSAGRTGGQKPLPAITEDEIPFAIPKTWKWVRFGDVYESVRGITFPGGAKRSYKTDGSVAVLRSGNLQNHLLQNNLIYVDQNKYVKNPDQIVRQYDVIVSMANSRDLVGKSIIAHDPLQQKYAIGGFLAIFRPHINPTFFQQVFSSGYARSVFLEKATQVTNIANLSLKTINLTYCPLPPLAEQTRIVQKTTQLLDLVSLLEEHLEK